MPKTYEKLPPLEVSPAIAQALRNYSRTTGVPMARIRREILYRFFEPMIADPNMAKRLEDLQAAALAAAASNGFGETKCDAG
ncbi:MAG: hypothetical protein KGL39_27300 [Patescibacteria group bacterium]|nr:hypothetical protein [Patescibacteria group bacterium]